MDAQRIREIFDAAVELPQERRAAFLREQCGGEPAVHAEIARLLEAYENDVEGTEQADALESIGPMIGYGAYEIVRELGRGGMGAVFLARRVDGTFERQVAVKVIRSDQGGRDSARTVLARAQAARTYRIIPASRRCSTPVQPKRACRTS